MLARGVRTPALAGLLVAASGLPLVLIGLVVLGGPAGVGSSLLFANLRHTGAPPGLLIS
jgi:SET family sugar efflux transporter-like MFS transporter